MSTQTDPVVSSGRREALIVLCTWLTALTYSIFTCHTLGYHRPLSELTFVCGFPEWVFWGVLVPWVTCLVVSWIFGALFIHDAHLGQDLEETEDELGLGG